MIQVPVYREPGESRVAHLRRSFRRAEAVAAELSRLFPKPHDMEMEEGAWTALFTAHKKNYCKWVLDARRLFQDATTDADLPQICKPKLSGLSGLKRSTCPYGRGFTQRLGELVLRGPPPDAIEAFLREELAPVGAGTVPLADLVVSCSLRDDYKGDKDNLAQVRVADKIQAREGYRPAAGSRVKYVVLAGAGKVYERAEVPAHAEARRLPLDWHHYLQQITANLALLLDPYRHTVDHARVVADVARAIDRRATRESGQSLLRFCKTGTR